MAHLEDMPDRAAADLARQELEECPEILGIELSGRRELPEDRAELLAQLQDAARKESLDRGAGLAERTAVVGFRGVPAAVSVTHAKFTASSVLPVPFHRATCGYMQSGRVRSIFPFVLCVATMRSGATPFSTHCSRADSMSNWFGPGPPLQWPIPGARKKR